MALRSARRWAAKVCQCWLNALCSIGHGYTGLGGKRQDGRGWPHARFAKVAKGGGKAEPCAEAPARSALRIEAWQEAERGREKRLELAT